MPELVEQDRRDDEPEHDHDELRTHDQLVERACEPVVRKEPEVSRGNEAEHAPDRAGGEERLEQPGDGADDRCRQEAPAHRQLERPGIHGARGHRGRSGNEPERAELVLEEEQDVLGRDGAADGRADARRDGLQARGAVERSRDRIEELRQLDDPSVGAADEPRRLA